MGHTDVNSGQLMEISKSRSGRGLGKVSSVELDIGLEILAFRPKTAGHAIDTVGRAG